MNTTPESREACAVRLHERRALIDGQHGAGPLSECNCLFLVELAIDAAEVVAGARTVDAPAIIAAQLVDLSNLRGRLALVGAMANRLDTSDPLRLHLHYALGGNDDAVRLAEAWRPVEVVGAHVMVREFAETAMAAIASRGETEPHHSIKCGLSLALGIVRDLSMEAKSKSNSKSLAANQSESLAKTSKPEKPVENIPNIILPVECVPLTPTAEQVERIASALWPQHGKRGAFEQAPEKLRAFFYDDVQCALDGRIDEIEIDDVGARAMFVEDAVREWECIKQETIATHRTVDGERKTVLLMADDGHDEWMGARVEVSLSNLDLLARACGMVVVENRAHDRDAECMAELVAEVKELEAERELSLLPAGVLVHFPLGGVATKCNGGEWVVKWQVDGVKWKLTRAGESPPYWADHYSTDSNFPDLESATRALLSVGKPEGTRQ